MSGPRILVRASQLSGSPVVTLGGEQEAEIKDVLFDRSTGRINGFTLNNTGLFSRKRKDALPWEAIHGLGRDAVMITGPEVLVPARELAAKSRGGEGDVLSGRVLTDAGVDVGSVVDVIIQVGAHADIVGYEIEASDALPTAGRKVLIPLPATLSVSKEHLMVPAAATDYVSDDLSGFGAAVDEFRARLGEQET